MDEQGSSSSCAFSPTCAVSTCTQYPVAGISSAKIGFPFYEAPDASPYGCNFITAAANCLRADSQHSLLMAYDSNYFTATTYGTMSYPVPSAEAWRFPFVFYQVLLDRAYDDVTAVDIWTTTTTSYNTLYTNALSIYLSPTAEYMCASCGITCATNWNATSNAPTRNTVSCSQTLNNTRYVTVHKTLFTPAATSDRIFIYEMRVVRSGVAIWV